jgi:DNA gyrase/topoisomerase IV subunit B
MVKKDYTSKDVRVLDEVEHIRLNPGMYVGDTNNPVHLVEEALDNALDEALAGFAKIIGVFVDTKTKTYSVLDNGRGIPIDNNTPITISCKLFSGAKFQDGKTAYEISSGLHGVGLVAVNALSEKYNIEIYRNKKHATYYFENSKLKRNNVEPWTESVPFATKIEFVPDKKFFEHTDADLKRIRKRLTTASAEMADDITFILVVDGKKEVFKLDLQTHFINSCLNKHDSSTVIRIFESTKGAETFKVLMTYEEDSSITPKVISSVNLLPVESGGTHVNCFFDVLKDFFIAKAKKMDFQFQPNDCFCGLRCYLTLKLKEPKFSGQSKEKLINRKTDFDLFMKELKTQIEDFYEKNPDELEKDLERFQEYRRKMDSKKLQSNGGSKRASTKFTKLRDCSTRTGELFVVEGDSAGGSILQCRNPKIHAVLPLKGKSIPNVTTKKDVLKNNEVGELIRAVGAGFGPEFDITKMRYKNIICATDADHDGAHIACLFTMVVATLLPQVIKDGRYFIAQAPLFAINEKKLFLPIWNTEELDKARKDGRNIQRYKGLGEMNPAQLKVCLLDEQTRNLIQIKYSENMEELVKLFSSATEKRDLVVGEE